MYSVVLLMAVTAGGESPDFGRCRRCRTSCCPVVSSGCGCVVLECAPPNGGGDITPEDKKIFETTLAEIKEFGDGFEPFLKEVNDIYTGTDLEAKKKWLDDNSPDVTKEEAAKFDKYLKGLKEKKKQEEEKKFWDAMSNPGRHYYLAYLGLDAEVKAAATLVVTLPADAKLTIDKQATTPSSNRRVFVSPPLEPNAVYQYTLDATYTLNGETVVVTKKVNVRAGKMTAVTLTPTIAVASR